MFGTGLRVGISAVLIAIFSTSTTLSSFAQGQPTSPTPGPSGAPVTAPMPRPGGPPVSAPSTVTVTHRGGGSGVSAQQAQQEWFCYGQTDRPHRSTHVPANANVVARTVCTVPMINLSIYTELYHWECWWWFGWHCNWILKSTGSNSNSGLSSIQTNAAAPCQTGDWGAATTHRGTWPDGNTFVIGTANIAYVQC